MAGRGRAPKAPEDRARSNSPERGEWQTLLPLTKPVLPLLPKRGKGNGTWSPRTRRMWAAWRADWVTQAWGPTETAMALELIEQFEEGVRASSARRMTEMRLQMDQLGLTMKGKRDLRLRVGKPAEESRSERPRGMSSRERYGSLEVLQGGRSENRSASA